MVTLTTKKLPVSISYEAFRTKSKEFLIPPLGEVAEGFRGLVSGKAFPYGAVSYVGKEVTVNDVFAKLVDSGQKIENVGRTLKILEAYLQMLQGFRIGNIITVEACSESPFGFRLKKVADSPPVKPVNLP